MIKFVYDDGGRGEAGYKGRAGDCVCRSIAIAMELDYQEVYNSLNIARANPEKATAKTRRRLLADTSARTGISKRTYDAFIKSLGWEWVPTMFVGQGCKVHLRAEELPEGRLICRTSRHLVAVIDGVIHDTHDPSRGGTRCVYGYYRRPE